MPKITCPNCGITINLENRRKIDFDLIIKATRKRPRTFTELLHITKLPRKTLSLRLKELCGNGYLVKSEHLYRANGNLSFGDSVSTLNKFSREFHNKRTRTGLMLVLLLVSFSVSGYVLANFFPLPSPKKVNQEPAVIGKFTMNLDVNNVTDLYGWQVSIVYNQTQLKVLNITQGNLKSYPFGLSQTDLKDELLLGGTLALGPVSGKNCSGTLAVITFGYFTEDYCIPQIDPSALFGTYLLNSHGYPIPIKNSTLALNIVK